MNLYIDYGGTNFRYQINEEPVQVQESKNSDLIAFLEEKIEALNIKKVAIAFAGQVNNGKIISAPNISLQSVDIKKYIENKYKVQLEIQNDLKCATLFENSQYLEYKSMVVIYIGTGVGCGFVLNDTLVAGRNNFAGEIGHIPFEKTPFTCGCSRDDCVELSLGGKALGLWSSEYKLNLKEITLEAIQNDPLGKPIYEKFNTALEHLFNTLLNVYDPELFVFGGGVMQKNPQLIENLEKFYEKSAFTQVRKAPKIVLSSSNNGPLNGAKLLLHYKGYTHE
ncbi:MAG: ROK family protein [Arcobacteraceae bacterium]